MPELHPPFAELMAERLWAITPDALSSLDAMLASSNGKDTAPAPGRGHRLSWAAAPSSTPCGKAWPSSTFPAPSTVTAIPNGTPSATTPSRPPSRWPCRTDPPPRCCSASTRRAAWPPASLSWRRGWPRKPRNPCTPTPTACAPPPPTTSRRPPGASMPRPRPPSAASASSVGIWTGPASSRNAASASPTLPAAHGRPRATTPSR